MPDMLSLSSKELDETDIQELTAELCQILVDDADIDAKLAEGMTHKGSKGEPVLLGSIALNFLSCGAATALINVLKSFFDRERSLEIQIQRENGTKVIFNAKNMQPEQIETTFCKIKEFIGEPL
jgi:hypothetical protein